MSVQYLIGTVCSLYHLFKANSSYPQCSHLIQAWRQQLTLTGIQLVYEYGSIGSVLSVITVPTTNSLCSQEWTDRGKKNLPTPFILCQTAFIGYSWYLAYNPKHWKWELPNSDFLIPWRPKGITVDFLRHLIFPKERFSLLIYQLMPLSLKQLRLIHKSW